MAIRFGDVLNIVLGVASKYPDVMSSRLQAVCQLIDQVRCAANLGWVGDCDKDDFHLSIWKNDLDQVLWAATDS